MIEQRIPRTKSVFQLGGAGSVGLQSLYGMHHLAAIINFAKTLNNPLHCWPFDGIEIPSGSHVLVEIYPGFYNADIKSDTNDAQNTTNFFLEAQNKNLLSKLFQISLNQDNRHRLYFEGWLPGV